MVNLSSKEKFLLEGEKYQQQLAIDKFNDFTLHAKDDNLRTLYARAIKKGLNSLHTEQGKIAVVKYAEKRNLEVPN